MTLKQNSTPAWVYAIWAVAVAVAILVVALFSHPGVRTYIVGGGIWATGIVIMIWQIIKSGDTTLGPYVVQSFGFLAFMIMSAT